MEEKTSPQSNNSLIKATITKIVDFGAFASYPGGQGLIYFTDIVPRVEHGAVDSVLNEGQQVDVVVKAVKQDGKVSLSMKIPRKVQREALVQEVKEDIASLSDEDTSIRAVWMALTEIEHYLLKYSQSPIPLKQDTAFINARGELTVEIDPNVHFDLFKGELQRNFNSSAIKHSSVPGLWYFDASIERWYPHQRTTFSEEVANLYIEMDDNPSLELRITNFEQSGLETIKARLFNYYPQATILEESLSVFSLAITYKTLVEKDEIDTELIYALKGIQEGTPDILDDETQLEFPPADFAYTIVAPENGKGRFFFRLNTAALYDEEGIRYSSLRGQNFYTTQGDKQIPVGILRNINFPKVTFSIDNTHREYVETIVKENNLRRVFPDSSDMTGEYEKVNRLNDSFDRITEHPEELVNPKLASYLFDASKATPLDSDTIELRSQRIRERQLNKNLNESQIEAIAKAVEAKDMALIQGPPGTGKSTAIAELIWQLVLDKPDSKILLTSEANLAVDNALDRIKHSVHNIIKPIRIAAGDKYSAEGLSYSQVEMKKWAEIPLNDMELADNSAAIETTEYQSFDPHEVVLNRWLRNIALRSTIDNPEIQKKWIAILASPTKELKQKLYYEYVSNCNVIGATCSAITDTNYTASEKKGQYRESRFLKKYHAVFGEADKSGKPLDLFFNTVIQDEASKATPSELSLPLVYGEKAVIIGDHRQLPPNLDKSDILFKLHIMQLRAVDPGEKSHIEQLKTYVKKNFDILEKSHFERLFKQIDPSVRGTFDTQYRMHEDINKVIQQFYLEDGGLKCGVKDEDRQHNINIPGLITPDDHVIWIDTKSPEIKDGTSYYNPGEINAVDWVLDSLSKSDSFRSYQDGLTSIEEKEIGLITFYGAQLKKLRPIVDRSNSKGLKIKMSSVDRFQGMERNIIIVSLVRSNISSHHEKQRPDFKKYPEYGYPKQSGYGFAESPNRLNVALSRSKRLLIIIGNGTHFSAHINKNGDAIYKNVYNQVQLHPNGIIPWKYEVSAKESKVKVVRVPMPETRSINLNTRDINPERDKHLRNIETILQAPESSDGKQKFAILELSTKAVKMLYSDDPDSLRNKPFSFDDYKKDAQKTETGQGLNAKNEMDMRYFDNRVMPVIRRMKKEMMSKGINSIYTVATAAYRTAKNRDDIIRHIYEKEHINVRILSKEEESIATMYAYSFSSRYRSEMLESERSFMIEQGGGSTEVSVFEKGQFIGSYSINIGTTTSRNVLFTSCDKDTDILTALRISDNLIKERMVSFVKNMGDLMTKDTTYFCVGVGTAITKATNRGKNAQQHDQIMTREKVEAAIAKATSILCQKFKTVGELDEWNSAGNINGTLDTQLTIRLGLPLYIYFLDNFNVETIHVCGTGLWYGIYLQKLFNAID